MLPLKIAIVLAGMLFLAGAGQSGEPTEKIRFALDKGIKVLDDSELKAEDRRKELVERLKGIVYPLFDFEEMARRSLGTHWRKQTSEEREEFVRLFTGFLQASYADKVGLYDGQKVTFGREVVEGDYARVDSTVMSKNGTEYSVVYRLHRPAGSWKIYDVVVENISLINNYRSQFNRVIVNDSYAELIKRLKEKTS
jgi:phospholipid transport system substrate-binding protein